MNRICTRKISINDKGQLLISIKVVKSVACLGTICNVTICNYLILSSLMLGGNVLLDFSRTSFPTQKLIYSHISASGLIEYSLHLIETWFLPQLLLGLLVFVSPQKHEQLFCGFEDVLGLHGAANATPLHQPLTSFCPGDWCSMIMVSRIVMRK